jgi:transposase
VLEYLDRIITLKREKGSCHEIQKVHPRFLELCRRYNISSGQLYTWKRQYAQGKLDPEPSREAELASRVRELERLVGKLTLENEFLKKAVQNSLKQAEKRDASLPKIAPLSKAFKGGAS